MLFNSYEFIFVFLPVVLVVFFVLGRASRNLALAWIIVASLLFYAWWRPSNIFIIGASIFTNLVFSRLLLRFPSEHSKPGYGKIILALGITFNLIYLGYFKYVNFIQSTLNEFAGTDFVLVHIILPLGISFFTFQQIAFLVDVHGRRIESFTTRDFCLFVLFFPQLIAGPIVHFREMMPQFHRNLCRFDREGFSVGLTLFCFGLFKKVVLADGIAPHVTPIYEYAAAGGEISLISAWVAALGFTLQIYFDFSGYSDMAAGLARCFGVRLPLNFNSPLKATSIIGFWSRWHVTLTRFLTAYVYNPLALWQTRIRVARGLSGHGAKKSSVGAFVRVLAGPTLLTMFLSGLWHGAGLLFILWGVLHGIYLTINHAWRYIGPGLWPDKESYTRFMRPVGFLLTFFSVVVGMVFFRSTSGLAATGILGGMAGLNGIALPASLMEHPSIPAALTSFISATYPGSLTDLLTTAAWIIILLAIALGLPNSIEVMANFKPVLNVPPVPADRNRMLRLLDWRPSIPWAVAIALLAAASVMRLGGESEFLYWQF